MLTRTDVLNLPPPAPLFRWITLFDGQPGPYKGIVETIEATYINTEAKGRRSQGSNNYFADTTDIESLNIMFYEDDKYSVTKWLKEWKEKVFNPLDGSYGVANDYKKRIYVELYNLKTNKPIMQLAYQNCWPAATGATSYSYEDSSGRVQVNQQFSVDTLEFSL
jgi:hypothetical protein